MKCGCCRSRFSEAVDIMMSLMIRSRFDIISINLMISFAHRHNERGGEEHAAEVEEQITLVKQHAAVTSREGRALL